VNLSRKQIRLVVITTTVIFGITFLVFFSYYSWISHLMNKNMDVKLEIQNRTWIYAPAVALVYALIFIIIAKDSNKI
jgi:hypothetical protein